MEYFCRLIFVIQLSQYVNNRDQILLTEQWFLSVMFDYVQFHYFCYLLHWLLVIDYVIITIIIGIILSRSIHLRCSVKKGVLRNFTNFTGKYLCQRFFFNKVAGHSPETLLKKSLCHRCFTMNFAKLLRTPFLKNTSGRLLLLIVHQTYETIRVSDGYSCSNQIQLKTNSLIIFKIHCSYELGVLTKDFGVL